MLILGGRYGSIEPDTKKNYVELEYRHAMTKGIPFFALVIGEPGLNKKIQEQGKENVVEQENVREYFEFKKFVESKTCRFFKDRMELKYNASVAIHEIEKNDTLIGWVRSDEAKSILNTQVMNESTTDLRKVVAKSWQHINYQVNQDITDELCLTALIDLSNINQKFVFYYSFLSDTGEQRWVGYTNYPDQNPGDNVENTLDILLTDTYHFVIVENVKKTIKQRFPKMKGTPIVIEKIRIRGDDKIKLPINFYYAFVEKK